MVLLSGIAEAKILQIKQEEIHEKAAQSIQKHGWLPGLFRGIIHKAKEVLQGLIRQQEMPPKPTLQIDLTEFRTMQNLMMDLQNTVKEIRSIQDYKLPRLNDQLANAKGLFNGKECKALEGEIRRTEQRQTVLEKSLSGMAKKAGYPNIQTLTAAYRKAEQIVGKYNRDLAEWERQKNQSQHPPEKESLIAKLRGLQPTPAKKRKRKFHDMER